MSETKTPYESHTWDTHYQSYGDIQPAEYVTFCLKCGIEDRGNPYEFDDLIYPFCGDESEDEMIDLTD